MFFKGYQLLPLLDNLSVFSPFMISIRNYFYDEWCCHWRFGMISWAKRPLAGLRDVNSNTKRKEGERTWLSTRTQRKTKNWSTALWRPGMTRSRIITTPRRDVGGAAITHRLVPWADPWIIFLGGGSKLLAGIDISFPGWSSICSVYSKF